MREVFYVYKLGKTNKGSGQSDLSSYGYDPIFIQKEPLPGRDPNYAGRYEMPPFNTKQEAVNYITSQGGELGPLVIVEAYLSDQY